MLEILLTSKIFGPLKIGDPMLKPFQPNGKSAPVTNTIYIVGPLWMVGAPPIGGYGAALPRHWGIIQLWFYYFRSILAYTLPGRLSKKMPQ